MNNVRLRPAVMFVAAVLLAASACEGADKGPEGRDVVDLLNEKQIEIEVQGGGIENVRVRIRRLAPSALTVRIPVGTYFVSANQSSQDMVTTAASTVRLVSDGWQSVSPSAACTNRSRDIPGSTDTFSVRRSPHQAELAKLIPLLEKARVDYATRQAAVWIVTDNADYGDLGTLVEGFGGFGGSRVIHEVQAARAMQICEEAGIDIQHKAIWRDRQKILAALKDGDVKNWLAEHR